MQFDRPRINLLIGGAIILILVSSVTLAVRPRDFFREARNATRRNHMQILITAVYFYAADNNGIFPECLPAPGQPAVGINECFDELRPYLLHLVPVDPNPGYSYMIESIPGESEKKIRIFSTAPEAKNVEVVR